MQNRSPIVLQPGVRPDMYMQGSAVQAVADDVEESAVVCYGI